MRRRLFNITAMISLLLCIGMIVLWVRSYWVSDTIARSGLTGEIAVRSERGVVLVGTSNVGHRQPEWQDHWPVSFDILGFYGDLTQGMSARAYIGFAYAALDSPQSGSFRIVRFPIWLPTTLFALLPARWGIARYRRRGLSAKNCCAVCGYDLRATPDRCPECGTVPTKAVHS